MKAFITCLYHGITVFCEVRTKYMYNVDNWLLQRAELYTDVDLPL
jgi:hypothetical protein